jgi:hypothetical protein
MKNIFLKIGLLAWVFIVSVGNATAQDKETSKDAAGVLRETIKAISNLSAVEYEVETSEERTLFAYKGAKVRAKTKILAAASPSRAVARLQAEYGATYEMFTLNNKIMQHSVAGKIGESHITKGVKPLVALGDFNNTWAA